MSAVMETSAVRGPGGDYPAGGHDQRGRSAGGYRYCLIMVCYDSISLSPAAFGNPPNPSALGGGTPTTGMNEPPAGWERWSDEPDRQVFVYRPDVFDSRAFPAPCLPTLYLSNGPHRNRRPEQRYGSPSGEWYLTCYLEPDVVLAEKRYDDRARAEADANELARRFAAGELDYRGAYQVPREEYLDRLDELTGREA